MLQKTIKQWLVAELPFSIFGFLAIALSIFHTFLPPQHSSYFMFGFAVFLFLPSIFLILFWLIKIIICVFRWSSFWINYAFKIFFTLSFLILNIFIHNQQNNKTLQDLETHFAPFVQELESYKERNGYYPNTTEDISIPIPLCLGGGEISYEKTSPQRYMLSCPHPAPITRYIYDIEKKKWFVRD